MSLNWPQNGPNNVPSYLISGLPFVTSSVGQELDSTSGNIIKIEFPYVTREISVTTFNASGAGLVKLGFTQNGIEGTETHNYITIPAVANVPVTSPPFPLRCKEIYLQAATNVGAFQTDISVYASLTGINKELLPLLTGSVSAAQTETHLEWDGIG